MLGMLTGTADAETTEENAERLQGLLRLSGDLLMSYGPDLIGTFVPGASLLARIGASAAEKAGVLDRFQRAPAEMLDHRQVEQSQIFEQYVNVLNGLAQRVPLLLILDDVAGLRA
jgi:hypothetical protein